jgi:hypothetical protein
LLYGNSQVGIYSPEGVAVVSGKLVTQIVSEGNIALWTGYGDKAYYNNNEIATVNQLEALEARIAALESAA